jgi:hypothetical protein
MHGNDDAVFIRTMSIVLGLLVMFTLVIMILANSLSPAVDNSSDPLVMNMMQTQLGPIGQSRVSE